LLAISRSKFGQHIKKITVKLHIDLLGHITSNPLPEHAVEPVLYNGATFCENIWFVYLIHVFRQTPQLKHLIIQGPDTYTHKMMNDLGDSIDAEQPSAQTQSADNNLPLAHRHRFGLDSPRALLHSILCALKSSRVKLESFEMLGFTVFPYRTSLIFTTSTLLSLAGSSSMLNLTALTLELDIFRTNGLEATTALVSFLERVPMLKDLKLVLQVLPGKFVSLVEVQVAHAPVLQYLASNPAFSLHTLDITGLAANSSHTLSDIVCKHTATLHTLRLKEVEFYAPNEIGAFVRELAASKVELLELFDFWLDGRDPLETKRKRVVFYEQVHKWRAGQLVYTKCRTYFKWETTDGWCVDVRGREDDGVEWRRVLGRIEGFVLTE
jgi:hypothetical protein